MQLTAPHLPGPGTAHPCNCPGACCGCCGSCAALSVWGRGEARRKVDPGHQLRCAAGLPSQPSQRLHAPWQGNLQGEFTAHACALQGCGSAISAEAEVPAKSMAYRPCVTAMGCAEELVLVARQWREDQVMEGALHEAGHTSRRTIPLL